MVNRQEIMVKLTSIIRPSKTTLKDRNHIRLKCLSNRYIRLLGPLSKTTEKPSRLPRQAHERILG